MTKNKRWIGVAALAAITAAALVTAVVVKNNLNKGPENTIAITQEGTDLGVTQIEEVKGSDGTVEGYKVTVEAKGFGETPIQLLVGFNATADTVTSVEVLAQSETDGLGGNIVKSEFLDQFKGAKLPVYIEGMNVSANQSTVLASELTLFSADNVELNDGQYTAVASEASNGYTSQVTVTIEGGKIVSVVWDALDESGASKAEASENGTYKMTEDGPTWAAQAKALGDFVVENQGVSGITMDDSGKTDAVASVSISVGDFVSLTEEALAKASSKQSELTDGTYKIVGDEPHNGYTSEVTVVVEGGKITEANWDMIDENGNYKSELSKNGEYVMTENGPTWADQAQALNDFVVANQGVAGITMDDNGKTDAVTSVSISVNEYVSQVEEAIAQASGQTTAPETAALTDGTYKIVGDEPHNGYTSEVTVVVEGGKITEANWDMIDENGNYKSELSKNGEYVMTENGPTWADQAQALNDFVVANQGVAGITMDDNGKTDAVTSVSISVNEYVSQVEEAIAQASGQEVAADNETEAEDTASEETAVEGTKVDQVSGATISTKAVLTAINNAAQYLTEYVVK